jgi:hypothetical protein
MSDKAVLVVLLYMAFAFGFGVLVGKSIRWGRTGTTRYTEEERCDEC